MVTSDYQFHWLSYKAKVYGKYLVFLLLNTVVNHTKLPAILMSNMAVLTDCLQILCRGGCFLLPNRE